MPLQDSNTTDSFDNTLVGIMGGTDNSRIGNSGDRLKVETKSNVSSDNANYDAFGRLRVSNPKNLFDSAFYYDANPLVFDQSIANSGTIVHNSNLKSVVLSTSAVSNSSAIMQSFSRMKYHAARSNMVIMSGNFGIGVSGVTKRIGQFDSSNGYFLEITSSGIYFVIRSKVSGSVIDNKTEQASWNIDTFNTLDLSKQNILFIDYQWLGSGRIRFGFVIDGSIRYCHAFTHANIITTLYSQTATLPLRFEISGNAVANIKISCCSVVSEGNDAVNGLLRTCYTGTTARSISGTTANFPLISLRKKSTSFDIMATLEGINIFCGSSDDLLVKLVKNATLTGASWTSCSDFCEFDKSATSYTGGFEVVSAYLRGASTGESILKLSEILKETLNTTIGHYTNNNSEIATISISNITSSTSVHGSINFKEVI